MMGEPGKRNQWFGLLEGLFVEWIKRKVIKPEFYSKANGFDLQFDYNNWAIEWVIWMVIYKTATTIL